MQTAKSVIKFTRNHPNRRSYNWLIYDTYEKMMHSRTQFLSGALYDLGSGESPYKDFFLNYAESYVAVDWADSFHVTNADIEADLNKPLPIESEVADSIISLSVLEHLCEPQLMLNEGFRILKKGGSIILQVPWQWWVHEAPHDYFRYTPYGLKYLFERAGFVDIEIEPQAGFFTTLVLKLNYFSLRLIHGPKLIRILLRVIFSIFWYAGQILAPLLDKLDRNWAAETCGYFVTARKP
jgi:SAM-dependent methyltransferase